MFRSEISRVDDGLELSIINDTRLERSLKSKFEVGFQVSVSNTALEIFIHP